MPNIMSFTLLDFFIPIKCIGLFDFSPWMQLFCDGLIFMSLEFNNCKAIASQVALVVKNPPACAGDTRDAGSVPG